MSNKLTTIILAICILMINVPISASATYDTANITNNVVYVSVNSGNEHASGSIDDPFKSIEAARDYMRTLQLDADNRGIIYIRGGVYSVSDSFELTSEDSYVMYSSYNGENVEITGSSTLEQSGFKKLCDVSGDQYSSQSRLPDSVKDKVYVYDLNASGIPVGEIFKNGFNWSKQPLQPELIVGGELQTLACYPNDGTYLTKSQLTVANGGDSPRNSFFDKTDNAKTNEEMMDMNGPVFLITDLPDSARKWAGEYDADVSYTNVNGSLPDENPLNDNTKYETDGWFSGYFANAFGNDNVKLYSIKNDNSNYYIYCKYPSMYGAGNGSLKFTAINLLCELDSEGEYYIDRYNGNNVLYYYPFGGKLGNDTITLNSLDKPLVVMNGAEAVQFYGISFTGTTNSGIKMTDCESCEINSCELYNISMDAIRIGDNNGKITADAGYKTYGGGHNNKVINCTIHDMGHGGVYMAGGKRKTLERGNNLVEHCEFYNFSRHETYTPAVYLEGMGNTARYNYIHDAPHMAIQIMGNDMLVTHNRIVNTCYNTEDMAPIYIGRGITWLGNEISYNYIDTVSPSKKTNFGVYMDDLSAGVMVHHNIFYKIGGSAIYSNTGYGNYTTDNIVIDGNMQYYRLLTNGHHKWTRPVPNEKTHKYRYYDIMRTYDEAVAAGDENKKSTKGYWNTQENIDKWVEYYNNMYNSLPEYSKNPDYAFDLGSKYFPDDNDASSDTWLDNNSLLAHANMTVVRNITVNTEDLWNRGGFYNNTNASDPETFDVKRHKADTVEELGIDLDTGKISNSSSLASDENYGQEWIDEWNSSFSVASAGVIDIPCDDLQLWLRADKNVTADDNGAVTSWSDLSGNSHNAAADAGTAPSYTDDAVNGYPAVTFDGTDDSMSFGFSGVLNGKSDFTIIAVASSDISDSTENTNPLLSFKAAGADASALTVSQFSDSISINIPEAQNKYSVVSSGVMEGFSTTAIVKSGSQIQIFNEENELIGSFDDAPETIDGISDAYGYIGGLDELFSGSIAEFIIYDTAVDKENIELINSYLNDRYYTYKEREIELTGKLDIMNGIQQDGITTPSASSKNGYIKSVFGQGGWQTGDNYLFGVSDDYRAAFDSDSSTYYDSPQRGYCGVEFYEPQTITKIGYQARKSSDRLNGAILQGSDDGIEYINIMTISDANTNQMVYSETGCTDAYKYIRLIMPGSNVLNLYELELYTVLTPGINAKITSMSKNGLTVKAESTVNGEFDMYTASYSVEGALTCLKKIPVNFKKGIELEISVDIPIDSDAAVFFWQDDMRPFSKKIVYTGEDDKDYTIMSAKPSDVTQAVINRSEYEQKIHMSAVVADENGDIIESDGIVTWSVSGIDGVTIDAATGEITVPAYSDTGTLKITAQCGNAKKTTTVRIDPELVTTDGNITKVYVSADTAVLADPENYSETVLAVDGRTLNSQSGALDSYKELMISTSKGSSYDYRSSALFKFDASVISSMLSSAYSATLYIPFAQSYQAGNGREVSPKVTATEKWENGTTSLPSSVGSIGTASTMNVSNNKYLVGSYSTLDVSKVLDNNDYIIDGSYYMQIDGSSHIASLASRESDTRGAYIEIIDGDDIAVTYTDESGDPAVGLEVEISGPDGFSSSLITDESGKVSLRIPAVTDTENGEIYTFVTASGKYQPTEKQITVYGASTDNTQKLVTNDEPIYEFNIQTAPLVTLTIFRTDTDKETEPLTVTSDWSGNATVSMATGEYTAQIQSENKYVSDTSIFSVNGTEDIVEIPVYKSEYENMTYGCDFSDLEDGYKFLCGSSVSGGPIIERKCWIGSFDNAVWAIAGINHFEGNKFLSYTDKVDGNYMYFGFNNARGSVTYTSPESISRVKFDIAYDNMTNNNSRNRGMGDIVIKLGDTVIAEYDASTEATAPLSAGTAKIDNAWQMWVNVDVKIIDENNASVTLIPYKISDGTAIPDTENTKTGTIEFKSTSELSTFTVESTQTTYNGQKYANVGIDNIEFYSY